LMWFWDPIDYGEERRRWFEAVAPFFHLVFLNEKGREGMWACVDASARSVHYIEEGVMVEGDRGPGRRPREMPAAASGFDVTFQGTVYPYPPDYPRVRVILALAAARGVDLAVYGPEDMWRELNITSKGMSYGVKSSHIHRASKVSLSLSREQPDVELYRSERLMDGAASGACVLSETFPGLDLLLPPEAVLTAQSPQEYVALVQTLVQEPAACESRRNVAMAAAWRYHTWDDSVAKFLSLARHARRGGREPQTPGLGVDCGAFCDGGGVGRRGRDAGRQCSPLCGEDNYHWKVGALLMGWRGWQSRDEGRRGDQAPGGGQAVVPGTAVEAGIYFWTAVRECPGSCAAWEGLGVALVAQGDSSRAVACAETLSRLKCLAPSSAARAVGANSRQHQGRSADGDHHTRARDAEQRFAVSSPSPPTP